MPSELQTPMPAPVPSSAPAGPVVEFVVANRSTLGWALALVGAAFLGLGVYCFYKVAAAPDAPKTEEKDKEKKDADDPLAIDADKDKTDVTVANPHQSEYILGGIIGLMGTIAGLGVAASVLAGTQKPTPEGQRTDARVAILLAGGMFGLVLMTAGLTFFILYFNSLTKWIDEKKLSEARWVLGPLMVFLLGAGLVFVSSQPARDEERNNPRLRQLIYGSNLVLTTLLLALLLLVGNVFAATRVPHKLDTTSGGVHTLTLSDVTRDYLTEKLNKTVQIYSILPEDADHPAVTDARRLLDVMQETNPQRVVVKHLSPTLNQSDITQLKNKYPQFPELVSRESYGVLLVLQENDKQAAFVPLLEMVSTAGRQRAFKGEAEVAKEMLALTQGQNQPVLYFTQGSGELEVAAAADPHGGPPAGRRASQVRTALERANAQVRRLDADPANPAAAVKVPDDADVVVVADPRTTLDAKTVDAIREFMGRTRGDKKGRLIVLAGAHTKTREDRSVVPTGVEPLLAEYGISLRPVAVYANPDNRYGFPASVLLTGIPVSLAQERNPIALSYYQDPFVVSQARPIVVAPSGPGGGRAQRLLVSAENRISWVESTVLANPEKTFSDLMEAAGGNPQLVQQKELTRSQRTLAAIGMDPDSKPRVVVYGSGEMFADPANPAARGGAEADLFVATVDYLRERPIVAIPDKKYGTYTPPKSADPVRLYFLPLGVAVLGLLALGIGVWVFRQK